MSKPKVAFYWCASCGGCEEAVVDMAEGILDIVALVDIVFWPVAMDFKKKDVEAMPEKGIDVAFINGAIRMSEQEEMAHLLRRKSKLVVAYGACAHLGGIPGLANFTPRNDILEYVYHSAPSVADGNGVMPTEEVQVPEGTLDLPHFYASVRTLDQVIDVDYYLPGCPPTPELTREAINTILSGELPPKGSVLAGTRALCSECPLGETKPENVLISEFKRVHLSKIDPDKCLLAQGFLCMGPVTRSGCGALCTKAHMPCTGCFGQLDRVVDYGGKAASAIASILDQKGEKEVSEGIDRIADPAGTFYRYSLSASLMGLWESQMREWQEWRAHEDEMGHAAPDQHELEVPEPVPAGAGGPTT